MNEDILITGGEGVLGSYFDFGTRMGQEELDITDFDAVMKVCADMRPKAIIHCAALTDLTFCEENPDKAYLTNTAGTYHMALAARTVGAKLIYVSTSGVFDGTKDSSYTEEDRPNPINIYGHSKYMGELIVSGMLDDCLIVRASWLFGGGRKKDRKFVGKIVSQADAREIRAVTDRLGSPTYAKDLAGVILKLVEEGRRGIVHISGGKATRHEIAKEIISMLGSSALVLPVVSGDFHLAYESGANESMSGSVSLRPWQEALREYIETEWSSDIKKTT